VSEADGLLMLMVYALATGAERYYDVAALVSGA
jgi:hypothetical protein